MSSFPSRMAKRALKARGFTREWRTPKDADKAYPCGVLDPEGERFADTWTQAAVRAGRDAAERRAQ